VGPLHGLPMTIKDTIETAGIRTTAGLQSYRSYSSARCASRRTAESGRGYRVWQNEYAGICWRCANV